MSSLYVWDDITAAMARSAQSSLPLLLLIHAPLSSPAGAENAAVDGLAQRAMLTKLVEKTGLSAVSVLHILEQGTTNYNNFIAVAHESSVPVPQIRVFAPARSKEPVKVLHGRRLNSADLYLAVTAALQLGLYSSEDEMLEMMQLRSEGMNNAATGGNNTSNSAGTAAATSGGAMAAEEQPQEQQQQTHTAPALPTNRVLAALQEQLQSTVEAMNRERQRSQQQQQQTHTSVPASKSSASAPAPQGKAAGGEAKKAAAPPSPPHAAPAVHLVHIEGLPHGKTRAVWTQPTMRLSTIWHEVRAALQRAVKEMQDAKEAGVFDGLAKEDRFLTSEAPERFALRLHKRQGSHGGSTANSASHEGSKNKEEEEEGEDEGTDVYVRSAAEAEGMFVQEVLPSGSAIRVVLPGSETGAAEAGNEKEEKEAQQKEGSSSTAMSASPATSLKPHEALQKAAEEAVTGQPHSTSVLGGAQVVCTGDSCVLVPRTTNANSALLPSQASQSAMAGEAAKAEAAATQRENSTAATTTTTAGSSNVTNSTSTSAAQATSITLRCSLPDGRMESVTGLSPQSDTLAQKVRPRIRALLGHDQFLFVRAYPPRRFSATGDELQPLQALGLTSSAALRVVINEDAPSAGQPASSGVAQRCRASRLLSSITGVANRNNNNNNNASGNAKAPAASSLPASAAGSASADPSQPPPRHNDPSEAMNTNLLTSMLRRLMSGANANMSLDPRTAGGRRLAGAEAEPGTNSSNAYPFAQAARPPPTSTASRSNFRSMAEVVDQQEEEQQRLAQQRLMFEQMAAERLRALRDPQLSENKSSNTATNADEANSNNNAAKGGAKALRPNPDSSNNNNKSNRYFGGDSTEYMAHDKEERMSEEGNESEGGEGEGDTAQPRFTAFAGEGRRLTGASAPAAGPQAGVKKESDEAEDKKKK